MQHTTFISAVEAVAIPGLAAPWDKSGIQVASNRTECFHVALCLDATPASLQQALALQADFVLAHHPFSMTPVFPDTLNNYHRCLSLLFRHDIPLYSAHTSLDANPLGPVNWLAAKLGLTQCKILEKTSSFPWQDSTAQTLGHSVFTSDSFLGHAMHGGFGCVGHLPHPLAGPDFLNYIQRLLPLGHGSLIGNLPKEITKVAYCPGSGSSLLEEVYASGADIFITGDFKYHSALDVHEDKRALCVLDVGHFSLEEEMMRHFALFLASSLSELKISFVPGMDPFSSLRIAQVPEVHA